MSMNNLNGNLETFSAVDILHLLARTGAGGALHLRDGGSGVGVVFVADGAVTLAARRPTDGLGDCLVRAGFLSADELGSATAAGDAGTGLARHLATKDTDAERLLGYLRHQTEEALFELSQWKQGQFDFQPDAVHGLDEAFRYPIADVLAAVDQRHKAWPEIEAKLPSLDAAVDHVVMVPGDDDEVRITKAQYRLLSAVDGSRSARQLAEHLGDGVFETCRVLGSLHDAGLVVFGDEAPGGGASAASAPAARDNSILDLSVGAMAAASKAPAKATAGVGAATGTARAGSGATKAPSAPTTIAAAAEASTNGAANGSANGHTAAIRPLNGSANGHTAHPSADGDAPLAAVPFRALPGGPDVSFNGEKPDRAVLLKLLSAVKDLEVSEKG